MFLTFHQWWKKSLSLLCEIFALLWTTRSEQEKPNRYCWLQRDKIYLNIIFPHLHAAFPLALLQMTKYQTQTKFLGDQKGHPWLFYNYTSIHNVKLAGRWKHSYLNLLTDQYWYPEKLPWDIQKRWQEHHQILWLIDQMCRWHGGEVMGCYYLWEISDSLT